MAMYEERPFPVPTVKCPFCGGRLYLHHLGRILRHVNTRRVRGAPTPPCVVPRWAAAGLVDDLEFLEELVDRGRKRAESWGSAAGNLAWSQFRVQKAHAPA